MLRLLIKGSNSEGSLSYQVQLFKATGIMAASEIPPQMANFQTFYRAAFYFILGAETAHCAHCYFVLSFSKTAHFGI